MAEKQLPSSIRAAEFQKTWFAQLRRDVFENQKPYAIVQADMPLELFQAMEIPVVSNQWWASLIAAKRLAPSYLDSLNGLGYHGGLCRYCSLGLASTIAGDPSQAPWGGLPKPAILSARMCPAPRNCPRAGGS
jgi:benzoyl-CoA reductase subunit B